METGHNYTTVSEDTAAWCARFVMCRGCRFAGNQCVAPHAGGVNAHNDWTEKMERLIAAEVVK